MMNIDEAIKHCEEKAEELKEKSEVWIIDETGSYSELQDCLECAREHAQLAEWLTDYKRLFALEDKIKSIVFSDSPDIAILKIKDIFTGENEE